MDQLLYYVGKGQMLYSALAHSLTWLSLSWAWIWQTKECWCLFNLRMLNFGKDKRRNQIILLNKSSHILSLVLVPALNYWAGNGTINSPPHCNCCPSSPSPHSSLIKTSLLAVLLQWRCRLAVREFWVRILSTRGEFLSWTPSTRIFVQVWMPIKSLLSKITFLTKVRVCSSRIYLWFAANIYCT